MPSYCQTHRFYYLLPAKHHELVHYLYLLVSVQVVCVCHSQTAFETQFTLVKLHYLILNTNFDELWNLLDLKKWAFIHSIYVLMSARFEI